MTDKQIIIDVCPYQGECSVSGCKRNDDDCFVRQLFEERNRAENRIVELNKSIQAKEQECETLASQLDFEVQKKECLEQECEKLNNDNHTLLVTRQKLLNDLWIAEESLKDFKEICDKQCEQLEAYKMEADEGKEINAELKAENEHLNVQLESCFIGEKELFEQLDQAKAELELYKRSKQVSYEKMQRRWNEVEQENRQLKRQHQADKGLITTGGKLNYKLIQEVDKLKVENENWQKEYWKLDQGNDFLAEKNSRLMGCLTEIKEIAEDADRKLFATISDDYTEGYCWLGRIILQKISECEVVNDRNE